MFVRLATAASTIACAGFLLSQPEPPRRVGARPDGSFLLNSGWLLKPAGRQIPLGTGPMASAVSQDGRYLLILHGGYLQPTVTVHDAGTLAQVSSARLADGWLGLTFAPKSNLFYVGGGSRASVFEFELTGEGRVEPRRTFVLVPEADRKHTDFIGDVQLSPDGRLIYAAALYRDSIFVINPQSGMIIEEWKTVSRPYRILFHPDGRSFFVTGWGDGQLRQHDAGSGAEINRLAIGPAPMDMVLSTRRPEQESEDSGWPYAARLFVALSNTNSVAVLGLSAERGLRVIERINAGLYPNQPAGMTPSALALSGDQKRLAIVASDANAAASVDISGPRSRVEGFIPTGWYPTAARYLASNRLMVLNGRGPRSFPNPKGPNPEIRRAPVHEGVAAVEYVGAIQRGSASLIDAPSPGQLADFTRQVLRNSPYQSGSAAESGTPDTSILSSLPGRPSPIEHVIYIVKENRTYDQILGDMASGNGDPSLCLFPEEITPNHHKLAREFVQLDNFYVNADVSADGHNWSSASIAPAYVQRMWPNSYGGRRRHYDYEGGERAAVPPAGYIWSNVLARGLSMRNYGWWCTNRTPAPSSGPQIAAVRDPALARHTNMDFRAFDLQYKDVDRARVFLKDLEAFERDGSMPRFMTIRIGNDHTSGTSPGRYSPKAAMADNDLALGMIAAGVSKSRFWPKTAIFVLEDDAQNGADHVDSHRSAAFILSPYTRGRGLDSSMYNTVSMLKTIEVILGLAPMTMHDAGARAMFTCFRDKPDTTPYAYVQPKYNLDERNPPNAPLAARSRSFDFEEADRIDDGGMNEILWLALKGAPMPAPARSYWGR
ncbi:MAG: hypothetical protein HXY18_19875 [Bryobacteraceae bacterium]|nr:hypothetical protein [Bryobacteraceae bacterium]